MHLERDGDTKPSAIGDIGGETDTFDISNQLLTNPVQCPTLIKRGASKASSITTIGQVRCFKFAGKNGEKTTTTLSGVTGSLGPLMDLFNPAGTSVAAGPGETITYTLTSTGTWVMLIEDNSGRRYRGLHDRAHLSGDLAAI